MCLGTLVRVTRIAVPGFRAECEAHGVKLPVWTQLAGPVRPGDYLLVHAGYALAVVDPDAARSRRELLEGLLAAAPGAEPRPATAGDRHG